MMRRPSPASLDTLGIPARLPLGARRSSVGGTAAALLPTQSFLDQAAAVGERGRVARGHCRHGCIVPAELVVSLIGGPGRSPAVVSPRRRSDRLSASRQHCRWGVSLQLHVAASLREAVPSDVSSVCLGPVCLPRAPGIVAGVERRQSREDRAAATSDRPEVDSPRGRGTAFVRAARKSRRPLVPFEAAPALGLPGVGSLRRRKVCRRFGDSPSGLPPSCASVTWLILPVVICLSQRLSHACLSMNASYCETANGSLNQL